MRGFWFDGHTNIYLPSQNMAVLTAYLGRAPDTIMPLALTPTFILLSLPFCWLSLRSLMLGHAAWVAASVLAAAHAFRALMQMPEAKVVKGKGPRGGGLILHESSGKMSVSTPVLGTDPDSPMELGAGSGWGISSFFDVFTELSMAPGGASPSPKYRRVLLQQGRLILETAEAAAGHPIQGLDSPEAERMAALDIIHRLCDDLGRLLMLELSPRP